jgi:hypothetical protein
VGEGAGEAEALAEGVIQRARFVRCYHNTTFERTPSEADLGRIALQNKTAEIILRLLRIEGRLLFRDYDRSGPGCSAGFIDRK